jgi:nucleoside-diphosphate-sugar epimerase
MTTVNVFLTGATGYIGGSLLTELLKSSRFNITALVRSDEKAKALREKGVQTIIGSIDDAELVTAGAYAADLVIETANCDHLPNAQAIVAGLERKFKETGKKPYYVHTSGSGILIDPNNLLLGQLNPLIYDDIDDDRLNQVPINHPHRWVDDYVIKHSGSYHSIVVAPTLIYGKGTGFEGIANPRSIQIPVAINNALKNRQAFQIGEGKNEWSNVHIDDVTSFYVLAINELLADSITTLGYHGYFFLENGAVTSGEFSKKIGEIGHKKGLFETADVRTGITQEEFKEALIDPAKDPFLIGSNSRCYATKARKLGWKPKHNDVLGYIEADFTSLVEAH